jgi:TIR domain
VSVSDGAAQDSARYCARVEMADIFLSYKKEDLSRVQPVIAALEDKGFSVWWDRKILPGKTFAQVIAEELKSAKVVVAVWSETSVRSDWVQIEATQGKRRGILVPLMIDAVSWDIPLEFSLMEAADLTDWDGASAHDEVDALLTSVSNILSASQEISPDAAPDAVTRYIHDRASSISREPTDVESRAEVAYEPATGRSLIFVSYRREDASGHAGRLYDHLADRFGPDKVAMDIDTLQVGVDFGSAIESALASSSVMIAIIGRNWLTVADARGERRLDNPDDFVRMELRAAFHLGLPVIPVLVGGARLPAAEDLPPDIEQLTHWHALEIPDTRWRLGVDQLVAALERLVPPSDTSKERVGRWLRRSS